jgi:hypothetical protein
MPTLTDTRVPAGRRCGAAGLIGDDPLYMTRDELTAFYRRYNGFCNEHRFDDLAEFVAPDVVINGTDHGSCSTRRGSPRT